MAQFAVGLALGALASLAIVLGILITSLAIVFLVAFAAVWRSLPALGGGLLALGSIWLTLSLDVQRRCEATADFCGNANFAPFLVISMVLVIAGIAMTGLAWWLNRRRSASSP